MKIIIPTFNSKKVYSKTFIDHNIKSMKDIEQDIQRRKNAQRNARLVNIITK